MDSRFLLPSAIVVCVAIYAVIYLRGIRSGAVRPVLATWLLFALAVTLSFFTDLSESGQEGILVNFFNLADSCAILTILCVVLFKKDTRRTFTAFEKTCIAVSVLVALLWLISGLNVLAHLSIQVILAVAYVPTLTHLWRSTVNTESLSMWFFDFLASFLGVIEPIRTHSLLPTVYGLRAVVCALLVMLFILRIRARQHRGSA